MEFNDKQAIYIQIADLICENILSGKWKEEERIPSVREVAGEIEVNPNTVMRSYAYLQDKQVIFNKRGIGFFIEKEGKARVMEIKKEEFIQKELPNFFKTIDLLNIPLSEIQERYQNYVSSKL
ncbi:MAG: GntR family transcriptional regulator [Bacteroidales bacterium]|nr:GntR family transcriptional regulator [Bacteroidales bacterium]